MNKVGVENQWGYQSWGDTPIVTVPSLSASTALVALTAEIKPGWGTLLWGQNGWGSVEAANETLPAFSLTSSVGSSYSSRCCRFTCIIS